MRAHDRLRSIYIYIYIISALPTSQAGLSQLFFHMKVLTYTASCYIVFLVSDGQKHHHQQHQAFTECDLVLVGGGGRGMVAVEWVSLRKVALTLWSGKRVRMG